MSSSGLLTTNSHNGSYDSTIGLLYVASTVTNEVAAEPDWVDWLLNSQLIISVIGALINFGTFITMKINGNSFGSHIRMLLIHQSLIDGFSCFVTCLLLGQGNTRWTTGLYWFDYIVCRWWHSQCFYWGSLFVSILNLILIAFERYIAVCHPLRLNIISKKKIWIALMLMYPLAGIATWGVPLYSNEMVGTKCVGILQVGSYYIVYAVWAFTAFYALPSIILILFYGMVVITLRNRMSNSALGTSNALERTSFKVTLSALIITIIFILTFSYNLWYFLLGTTGVFDFQTSNFHQLLSTWFTSFNCFVNPVVYFLMMPAFRRAVGKTFGCLMFCRSFESDIKEVKSISSSTTDGTIVDHERA